MSAQAIERALRARTPALMALPGVVGTAEGLCERRPCIKVLVVTKTPELERDIHAILEGYPVVIEETGRIRARPEEPSSP